jgi:hypothetical protein
MDEAISALGGAFLGGAATFAGVWWTQQRVDRRAAEKAEEERQDEVRRTADLEMVAARVLQEDLAWAEGRIRLALDNGCYWSARYGLKRDAWLQRRDQIAVALDDSDDWLCVREGFHALQTLELQAAKDRLDDLTRTPVGAWGREQLRGGLVQVEAAIEVLEPIAKDRPRQTLERDPEGGDEEVSAINSHRDDD